MKNEIFEIKKEWKDNSGYKDTDINHIIDKKEKLSLDKILEIYNRDKKNNNILRIPPIDSKKNNKKYNYSLFSYKYHEEDEYKVITSNLVGVLQYNANEEDNNTKSIRVEIGSRFDLERKQYFLIYMLCKVLGINILNNDIQFEEDEVWDTVLIIIFINKLTNTFQKGVYKEYRRFEYNEFNFKGCLNVARHIKLNTPFLGRTAYTSREHTYDNDILCLIRQTINHIKSKYNAIWDTLISNMYSQINEIERILEEATPSFIYNKSYELLNSCHKEISHPFFHEYEDLRKVSLKLLTNKGINIFTSKEESVSGIIIDVAWLWEQFVSSELICNKSDLNYEYKHLEVNDKDNGLKYFIINNDKDEHEDEYEDKYKYKYPDFIENKKDDEPRNVFDAKYKKWSYNEADINQILGYLFITGGNAGGVIYPTEGKSEEFRINNLNTYYKNKIHKAYYFIECPFYVPNYDKEDKFTDYANKIEEKIKNWKSNFNDELEIAK